MLGDLIKKIERVIGLVPYRYWNALAVALIVLLGIGVGNTLMTSPELPETVIAKKKGQNASFKPLIKKGKPKSVTASISGGNIFRRQRKDSEKRPPPSAKSALKLKPAKPAIEPEITLHGTIVTETERIAIIDAKVEKFERREIPSRLVISGVYQGKQVKKWPDGKYYTVRAAGKETLKKRTFREGEKYSNLLMERIFEDRIEVKNLSTGETVSIYFKIEEPKKARKPAQTYRKTKMARGAEKTVGGGSVVRRGSALRGRNTPRGGNTLSGGSALRGRNTLRGGNTLSGGSALRGGSVNENEKEPTQYISGARTR